MEKNLHENGAEVKLNFDVLDCKDGACIRLITTGQASSVTLKGTVVHLPAGFQEWDFLRLTIGLSANELLYGFFLNVFLLTSIPYFLGFWGQFFITPGNLPYTIFALLLAFMGPITYMKVFRKHSFVTPPDWAMNKLINW